MPQPSKPLDDTASMAAWFGTELRNWRQERKLSSRELGERVHVSGSYIEKIEKAERSCNAALAAQLDDALHAGGSLIRLWRRVEQDADNNPVNKASSTAGPAALGILPSQSSSIEERSAVERRTFTALAATGITAVALDSLGAPLAHATVPSSVRPHDIEQVRRAAVTLAGWDNLYGGAGIVRASATGQFTWAKALLDLPCSASLWHELLSAVGRLATVMGASAFDAYEHDEARGLLRFATLCAEEGGDWHLRANALNWRARQEIWCGNPDVGLTHAENGLVRADRLTPREQSMLHNARARALGKMGQVQPTLRAVGTSDDVFAHARPGEDASWMAYYDNAQHHGDTGHALYDLALLTEYSPRPAARRFTIAISNHTDDYVRSRAISRTKLASLTMATSSPEEAVAIGHQALDEVGQLRSRRAAADVRDLEDIASKRRGRGVPELCERIRADVLT